MGFPKNSVVAKHAVNPSAAALLYGAEEQVFVAIFIFTSPPKKIGKALDGVHR